MMARAAVGVGLAAAGAVLDFASGVELILSPSSMSMGGGTAVVEGLGLWALGIFALAIAVLMASKQYATRMTLLGGLMEVCGILMGVASAYVPSMNALVANVMLVVAILMFVNGALMQSRRRDHKTEARTSR
jgi:hypothetical protein